MCSTLQIGILKTAPADVFTVSPFTGAEGCQVLLKLPRQVGFVRVWHEKLFCIGRDENFFRQSGPKGTCEDCGSFFGGHNS